MNKLLASALALLLALAAAGCASEPTATPGAAGTPPTATAANDDDDDGDVVCKQEAPTGTRFAKTVCTDAESRRAAQDKTRDTQANGTRAGSRPGT